MSACRPKISTRAAQPMDSGELRSGADGGMSGALPAVSGGAEEPDVEYAPRHAPQHDACSSLKSLRYTPSCGAARGSARSQHYCPTLATAGSCTAGRIQHGRSHAAPGEWKQHGGLKR